MVKKAIGIIAIAGLLILILTNLIGWSFYNLVHYNSEILLASFGFNDPNTQNLLIIVGAIVILIALGYFIKQKVNVFGWIK